MLAILSEFAIKHLKWVLPLVAVVGLSLYAGWEHHDVKRYQAQIITLRQAGKLATAQAKVQQAEADSKAVAQAQQLAQQARKAVAAASEVRAAALFRVSATQHQLKAIYAHRPNAEAWRDVPIPASVLAAARGDGS